MITTLLVSLALLAPLQFNDPQPPAKDAQTEETIRIADQLVKGDALDRVTNAPCKVHVIRLSAEKTYLVSLTRKDNNQPFNPFLRVEDSEFKQLVPANANFFTARAKFTPPKDDDYRFIATCQGGNGEYVLKIAPYDSARIKKYEPGKVHEVGKEGIEYDSTIANTDARDARHQNSFSKVFEVKLTKGKTYTIDMESTQFDSYLRLEDGAKAPLREDDDSGGNLNARIIYQAPADGTYRIIATTFQPGAGGAFTLRIQPD